MLYVGKCVWKEISAYGFYAFFYDINREANRFDCQLREKSWKQKQTFIIFVNNSLNTFGKTWQRYYVLLNLIMLCSRNTKPSMNLDISDLQTDRTNSVPIEIVQFIYCKKAQFYYFICPNFNLFIPLDQSDMPERICDGLNSSRITYGRFQFECDVTVLDICCIFNNRQDETMLIYFIYCSFHPQHIIRPWKSDRL